MPKVTTRSTSVPVRLKILKMIESQVGLRKATEIVTIRQPNVPKALNPTVVNLSYGDYVRPSPRLVGPPVQRVNPKSLVKHVRPCFKIPKSSKPELPPGMNYMGGSHERRMRRFLRESKKEKESRMNGETFDREAEVREYKLRRERIEEAIMRENGHLKWNYYKSKGSPFMRSKEKAMSLKDPEVRKELLIEHENIYSVLENEFGRSSSEDIISEIKEVNKMITDNSSFEFEYNGWKDFKRNCTALEIHIENSKFKLCRVTRNLYSKYKIVDRQGLTKSQIMKMKYNAGTLTPEEKVSFEEFREIKRKISSHKNHKKKKKKKDKNPKKKNGKNKKGVVEEIPTLTEEEKMKQLAPPKKGGLVNLDIILRDCEPVNPREFREYGRNKGVMDNEGKDKIGGKISLMTEEYVSKIEGLIREQRSLELRTERSKTQTWSQDELQTERDRIAAKRRERELKKKSLESEH